MKCEECIFYRPRMKRRAVKYKNLLPIEFVEEPTGQGECMLHPPSVAYQQAAIDRNNHWAGETTSVVEPGFKQGRPIVLVNDFCGSFQSKLSYAGSEDNGESDG